MRPPPFPPPSDAEEIHAAVAALGAGLMSLEPIAPDASTRRFYRLGLADHPTLVACVYPAGEEGRLRHDLAVQQWAWRHRLPVPEPVAASARVTLSADLGSRDLDGLLRRYGDALLPATLVCLKSFQECTTVGVPNPPFDAALFRRELAGFAVFLPPPTAADPAVNEFFDRLSSRLEEHPYRLVHRDFHANNLVYHGAAVWAVDYQDLRVGPDTYDLVSLLRERAGAETIAEEERWCAEAAALLGWNVGWRERYVECACQRGLKVLGTFLRLAKQGLTSYLAYLPAAARKTHRALAELQAPGCLIEAVASLGEASAYNRHGEEP